MTTTSPSTLDTRHASLTANAPRQAAVARPGRLWPTGLLAALAWAAFGAITWRWPNKVAGFSDWAYTEELGIAALVAAAALAGLALAGASLPPLHRTLATLRPTGPWLVALPLGFLGWEILTAKTALLPTPFFAPPQALIEVYVDDWRRLGDSVLNTIRLLGLDASW